MITAFLIACLVVFGFLFLIWNRSDTFNLVLKTILFGMTGWTAFLLLQNLGYIIKT